MVCVCVCVHSHTASVLKQRHLKLSLKSQIELNEVCESC